MDSGDLTTAPMPQQAATDDNGIMASDNVVLDNPPAAQGGGTVTVLARGLSILKAFVPKNEWLSNQELAVASELPKATVSRLTVSLTELGMLQCSPSSGKYRLGAAALTLGYSGFLAASPWVHARAEMRRFADQYGAVVVIALREQLSMVCVEACQSELGVLSFRITNGSRLALPFSATGRAYYGSAGEEERKTIRQAALATFPARKGELVPALADAVVQMKEQGFYVSISSLQHGINGLGTVLPPIGPERLRYVVGCAAPMNVFTEENLVPEVWPRFHRVVEAVETCLQLNAKR